MIKCDKENVEIVGMTTEVLAELGVLTESIIISLSEKNPYENAVDVVKLAVEKGIELSGKYVGNESERMQEVAKILKEMEEKQDD